MDIVGTWNALMVPYGIILYGTKYKVFCGSDGLGISTAKHSLLWSLPIVFVL